MLSTTQTFLHTLTYPVKAALLTILLLNSPAFALQSDSQQPINIESNEQLADLNENKIVFLGKVSATQGSIELHAEKAELQRDTDNQLKSIRTWGNPVTYKQMLDNGKTLRSESSTLEYFPITGDIILSGRATVWQGDSFVSGERIEYNQNSHKMKATNANTSGGRVQSTFIPADMKSDKKSDKKSDQKSEQGSSGSGKKSQK